MKKIIDWTSGVVDKYFRSFDNEPVGYSRTKLVAYAFAAISMLAQWAWMGDTLVTAYDMRQVGMYKEATEAWDLLLEIQILNATTILSLLGIKAYFKKKDEAKIEKSQEEAR